METYDSEQEQVEAVKKWWKENGRSVIAGLVIGIGGMVGWKSWVGYQEVQAVSASTAYDQLVQMIESNRHDEASQHGDRLVQAYPGSAYAGLSSLLLARVAMQEGDTDAARQHLQWVADHAGFPELRHIAALRLARLLLQDGQTDAALSLLDDQAPQGFAAAYAETRGDALLAKRDIGGARAAYTQALASLSVASAARELLQMKLDDLGPAAPRPPSSEEVDS